MSGALLRPATGPRPPEQIRVLVVDATSGATRIVASAELPSLFLPGDLLVVNDAATVPASLAARTEHDEPVEVRLLGSVSDRTWTAVLLGDGDHRQRTEDRPPPPPLSIGARLSIGASLIATVVGVRAESTRLVDLFCAIEGEPEAPLAEVWSALYRSGRPVQYAYVPKPLALWDVQNAYAGRPWAVEMPSAGRALRVETLLELSARGVDVVSVTHAAGLSATGDAALDAMLPLPERSEVTAGTWAAIAAARARGGRVVAIGTSVARALEGGARGVTDLRIGPDTRRGVVDAVLTGVHEADTSHFALLTAFARREVLERALVCAEEAGLFGHELGDACLVWGEPRDNLPLPRGESAVTRAAPKAEVGATVSGP
jgi:S-adenosylmethionine:tRNA ribosyltransferase-isomerase